MKKTKENHEKNLLLFFLNPRKTDMRKLLMKVMINSSHKYRIIYIINEIQHFRFIQKL